MKKQGCNKYWSEYYIALASLDLGSLIIPCYSCHALGLEKP